MVNEDDKKISSESLKLSSGSQEENKVVEEEVLGFIALCSGEKP